MDFILTPIPMYLTLAASVIVFFGLFLNVSSQMHGRERRYSAAMTELKGELDVLRQQLQSAAVKRTEEEETLPAEAPVASTAMGSAMNLTKRAQALRLHRLGSDPSEIARRLGVAKGEVMLAVKMHQMLIEYNSSPQKS